MFFYIFGLKKMISACIYVAAPHICMHFIPHLYRPAVLLRDKLPENRKNSANIPLLRCFCGIRVLAFSAFLKHIC